ncbi:MAG: hypothetical protein DRI89_01535 [Bacteroidetes bacterium]|nr:MAG: hypothetical protein DRI89_01535 [Bacteroidota bacterium]
MKNLLLLITFTFFLSVFSFSQEYGWTDISGNMPEYANLNDVHFIGDEIWISGWNNGVFYSSDGGETFQIQPIPANSGITSSVFMKTAELGYVVTYLGNILKTTDGGTTWTTMYEPGGVLNSVHFPPNSETGYACGTNGTVWSFDDTSITDISPPDNASNLQSICFPEDNNDGKVCGQTTVARYLNNTWSNLQFYDCTLFYNSIFFIDDTTGWSVGINGTIIRTINGTHWVVKASNTTKNLNDVFFINSLEGWSAGTEVLLHSVDEGETWTQELASQTIGMELTAIYFTSANNGYVVGNYTVLKYGELSGIGEEIKSLQCNISPNPAKDKLQIKCPDFRTESGTIAILSLYGKELLKREIVKGVENIEIDVNKLESGMYFCRVRVDNKSVTKKLIIQK